MNITSPSDKVHIHCSMKGCNLYVEEEEGWCAKVHLIPIVNKQYQMYSTGKYCLCTAQDWYVHMDL